MLENLAVTLRLFRHFIATSFGNPFAASSPLRLEKQLFQDEAVFTPFPCFIRALTTEKMNAA